MTSNLIYQYFRIRITLVTEADDEHVDATTVNILASAEEEQKAEG